MDPNIKEICSRFEISGSIEEVAPYGTGHINQAFLVSCSYEKSIHRYLLQKINNNVFKQPEVLMENAVKITSHIYDKLKQQDVSDIDRRVMTFIPAKDGRYQVRDDRGSFWRMSKFIEDTVTYDVIGSPRLAFEAARMFGWFQEMITDIPPETLRETIPDFHNTPKRLADFKRVLEDDPCGRAVSVKVEIDFILEHSSIASILTEPAQKGLIPVRIVHNDTKINNVLFDSKSKKGLCVVDLDTVMPGLSLYDFGDMVRTATCTAEEDQTDLSKVCLNGELFHELARGYMQQANGYLNDFEKQNLVNAGKVIIYEQLIRFLVDHLVGELYYKTHRPGHNLDRARTQMKLLQSLLDQEKELEKMACTLKFSPH